MDIKENEIEWAINSKTGEKECFIYDGVVSGHKTSSWSCPLYWEKYVDEKGKQQKRKVPYTVEPRNWWTGTYTVENGAFWYKVG